MANLYSFVTLKVDGKIITKTVTREQGIKMQAILDGTLAAENEAQATFVKNIRRIDPLHGAAARKVELSVMETTHGLTNEGIEQGMSQAIPSGDR